MIHVGRSLRFDTIAYGIMLAVDMGVVIAIYITTSMPFLCVLIAAGLCGTFFAVGVADSWFWHKD